AGVGRRHDLLRARHLRHRLVADEAHRLDARQPGGGEAAHELRAHRRREHVRLVLEPVARPHVADEHVHAQSVDPAPGNSAGRPGVLAVMNPSTEELPMTQRTHRTMLVAPLALALALVLAAGAGARARPRADLIETAIAGAPAQVEPGAGF